MSGNGETLKSCPNCNASLTGFVKSSLMSMEEIAIINHYADSSELTSSYCSKCGKQPFFSAASTMQKDIKRLQKEIQASIHCIPVISAQSPLHWDYAVLGMVTGQSSTGTGVFNEIFTTFTDFFGTQSKSTNKKLVIGEELCFSQLRHKTLEMGGNAVIATDIDYSEVGAGAGILMICMAGTAIRLKNPEILGELVVSAKLELQGLYNDLDKKRNLLSHLPHKIQVTIGMVK